MRGDDDSDRRLADLKGQVDIHKGVARPTKGRLLAIEELQDKQIKELEAAVSIARSLGDMYEDLFGKIKAERDAWEAECETCRGGDDPDTSAQSQVKHLELRCKHLSEDREITESHCLKLQTAYESLLARQNENQAEVRS